MEIVQPIPTRAKIARAWLEHAHSFDRCVSSGRFPSVLATDWSDENTIKMITARNRKRMAEGILSGILFSVCRTCNKYIISNNHPLDLFGEKTIREGIVRD